MCFPTFAQEESDRSKELEDARRHHQVPESSREKRRWFLTISDLLSWYWRNFLTEETGKLNESWQGKNSERSWCCLFVKCGGQSSAKFSVRCSPFRPGLRLDLVIAEWWNHLNWFNMSLIGAVRLQLDLLISLLITFVYKCCKSAMYFWWHLQHCEAARHRSSHQGKAKGAI